MDSHPHAPLPPSAAAPQLRCVLLCDLVNSTRLVEVLGDIRAAELIREHDRLARELVQRHRGQEIDKTDGFLLLFERPIEAVRFALDYQRGLRALGERLGQPLRARVGVHVGEVLSWRNDAAAVAAGAKPVEVEGLAKAIAARLMTLADAGQVLLSESAYTLALRARDELSDLGDIRWAEHGRYRLQGVARPLPVYEVGEAGPAPLAPPADKSKARRILPWYRWKPLFAVLVLALVAAPIWYALKPAPAIAFTERDWIVVGDLRNLTGDARFDGALDTAIRIGLEQSQYVNLVANLKTRDTLRLMQRDPETRLDREVGSEVAQRVGARALLLPALTTTGGRLRFTAELVDPASGITVYTHSNEVPAVDNLLATVDDALTQVRDDLGESLPAIEKSSMPLPAATTASIDALRAYALANRAYAVGDADKARALFEDALKLDPAFDLAQLGLARLHLSRDELDEAAAVIARIDPAGNRLTARQRLYADALRAWAEGYPEQIVSAWQRLGEIYPDDYGALANEALASYQLLNRYPEALRAAKRAVAEQNALLPATLEIVARMQMAEGHFEEARQALREAVERGSLQRYTIHYELPAAEGRRQAAETVFAKLPAPAAEPDRVFRHLFALVRPLQDGRWREAVERVQAARRDGEAIDDRHAALFRLTELSLQPWLGEAPLPASAWQDYLQAQAPAEAAGNPMSWYPRAFRAAAAAVFAARDGQREGLLATVDALQAQPYWAKFPLLDDLRDSLLLELGDGDDARAAEVAARALDGRELQLLRASRVRWLLRAGRYPQAQQEALALAAARGRAFAEENLSGTLLPLNVWQVELAWLDAAEAAQAQGDGEQARRWIEPLLARWPQDALPPALQRRVRALQSALTPTAGG